MAVCAETLHNRAQERQPGRRDPYGCDAYSQKAASPHTEEREGQSPEPCDTLQNLFSSKKKLAFGAVSRKIHILQD